MIRPAAALISRCCRTILLLILPLLFAGCFSRALPNNHQGVGSIQGVVTDATGKPMEIARVYAYKWLYDEESIEEIIQEGTKGESAGDYGAYRGPADFKSGKTGSHGKYKITLSPGTYCVVARKRRIQTVSQGPLNPEDFSSLVSEPITVKPNKTAEVSLKLLNTLRDADFFRQYLIRSYRTGVSGRVVSLKGGPVSEVIVTANKTLKINPRPDFSSSPTDREGKYTLYVFPGGAYHFKVKSQINRSDLRFHLKKNPEKIVFIPQGRITANVNLVLEEDKPVSD